MEVESSPRTRKRERSFYQQLNNSSPAANTSPLSAVKRRKLGINGSSPSTPKALQALKTAIGGVFNFGKTKEIVNGNEALETASQISKDTDGATAVFDEFIDELLAEESQDQGINGDDYESESHISDNPKPYGNGDIETQDRRPPRKGRRSRISVKATDTGTVYDVDELFNHQIHHNNIKGNEYRQKIIESPKTLSEKENETRQGSKSARKRKRSRSSVTAKDAEAAEDELSAVAVPRAASNSKKTAARTGSAETFKNQNLKWRTKPTTTKAASPDINDGARDASAEREPISRSAGRPSRERRRPRRYSDEMLEDFLSKPKADTTPSKMLDLGAIMKSNEKLESAHMLTPSRKLEPQIKSTPREKLEPSILSTPSKKPQPRSILTPSKSMRERPRKSVTFGEESSRQDDPALDLQDAHGGEMIERPTPSRKKRGRPMNMANAERRTTDLSAQRNDVTEEEASIKRDENRRSPRQKADSMLPRNSKPLKEQEPSLKESSFLEEVTPSKERRLRSPKHSVSAVPAERYNRQERRGASAIQTSAPEDKTGSNSDEITCVICGGGDSEPPNEILLCDNCDLAAHQICYGVKVIPEGDWLCRDCRPDEDEELMLVETGTVSEPSIDIEASNIPDIEGFEYHMQVMQKLVLDKLTGQRRLKLYGLDEEYRKVYQVAEQTVLAGEGNSMLVIGARGCGKTAVSSRFDLLKNTKLL